MVFFINNFYFFDFFFLVFFMLFLFLGNSYKSLLFGTFFKFLVNLLDLNVNFKSSSFLSSLVFFLTLSFCFFGYFSYSICLYSYFEFTLFMSLSFWISTFYYFISTESFMVYLSKSGDKFLKSFSMLLIELVSEFSRPIALTVRLTVNIMVGHLLVYSLFLFSESCETSFSLLFLVFCIFFEFFVFFIQSYIFSRLLYLYVSE